MLILHIDPETPEFELIDEAVDALLDGGLVAFPTDTIYGLGCDATNGEAVERLIDLKGRDVRAPLPVMIHSRAQLRHLVADPVPELEAVLSRFWPGALTVVFRRRGQVLQAIPPRETLGLRIPDCPIALTLARRLARPVVATSANLKGRAPLQSAEEIAESFGEELSLVIDGGPPVHRQPSTVLDVSGPSPTVLREGAIPSKQVLRYFGSP